ncbi:MAG: CPBP family intramembrane metalloprotease [Bacteroidaceae bacterium]|nr:CPBP family intramembrane metalloprotease [Bacteroidaceae bacterium]
MNLTAVNPHRNTSQLILSLVVAALLWFIMFSPWTSPHINFWVCMTASALILTCLAFAFGGKESIGTDSDLPGAKTSTVLMGILIAVALWGIFWIGDKLSQLLFSFSRAQVNLIYDLKDNFSPTLLALLLLFIIGPAEEIFWRGYIQRTLSKRLSPFIAFLLTTACYTLVHLPSGNFMLIMAALVCGIVWGGLYWLMPQNLRAIIISHALWDAAAFVWLPF